MPTGLEGAIIAALIGITAAVKAADWFVAAGATLADGLRLPRAAFGATVMAMVAITPELAVVVRVANAGRSDLAVTLPFASAATNLCLALAALALVAELGGAGMRREAIGHLAWVCVAGALAGGQTWAQAAGGPFPGLIVPPRLWSGLSLAAGCAYVAYWLGRWSWRRSARAGPLGRFGTGIGAGRRTGPRAGGGGAPHTARARGPAPGRPANLETSPAPALRFWFAVVLVLCGSAALAGLIGPAAAAPAVGYASPTIIAAAAACALPEVAVALVAGRSGCADLALGLIAGASALNLTVLVGLAGLSLAAPAPAVAWGVQAPLVTLIAVVVLLFFVRRVHVRMAEAATLVVLYLAYLAALIA